MEVILPSLSAFFHPTPLCILRMYSDATIQHLSETAAFTPCAILGLGLGSPPREETGTMS